MKKTGLTVEYDDNHEIIVWEILVMFKKLLGLADYKKVDIKNFMVFDDKEKTACEK